MRLCRFNDGRLGVADPEASSVADVTEALDVLPGLAWPVPPGDQLIRHLPEVLEAAAGLLPDAPRLPLAEVTLLSPVANPSKIVAAPLNYVEHTREVGEDVQIHANTHTTGFEGFRSPVDKLGLFLKATTSLVGAGEGLRLIDPERRTDHEVELAVVIGREARDVSVEHALDVVAGYCIALDMTVRGTEDRSMRKSADTYTVLGPWLVSAEDVPAPGELDLSIKVGDAVRQESNTRLLTVGVAELIALASRWYTLHPGDLLLTGTPDGVGPVSSGDVMTSSIDGIGEMRVHVH
jgi:2-keto-4-pentenoate hydratase/2-oxohepta-3-ene-1,7-dioic acid hydratase in catechol pathway